MTGRPETARSLGGRVGRGAAWSLLNTVVLRAGVLVSGIVLARLLTPTDYGVFAVALVATTLMLAVNELGVSLALVRWERDPAGFAPTAMTISMAGSALLYAGAYLLAPAFCAAMGSPGAVTVVRVLCVAVLFDGVAVVPASILNRVFAQGRRFVCDLASFAVSTTVTIVLAAKGHGAMSFAIGRIAGNAVSVTLYLALCPVPVRPGWDRALAAELVRFGLPLAGASLLVLGVVTVDQVVVGALADEATLGLYLMALNVANFPVTALSEAARRVSLAGFSRLVDDPAGLQRALARGLGLLMAAVVPVSVLLVVYAEAGLTVVYGQRWAPAAAALQVLAALGLLRVLLFVGYDLMVAAGRTRPLLAVQAGWLVVLVPALALGTSAGGTRGTAVAHVLVAAGLVLPVFAALAGRLGLRLAATFAHCGRPAAGGLLIAASAAVVHRTLDDPVAVVVCGGLLAAALYLPVVLPMRALLPAQLRGPVRPAGRAAEGGAR